MDHEIRKYLLGDLPESEAERIESWYFADGQAVDEVWVAFGEMAEERLSGSGIRLYMMLGNDDDPSLRTGNPNTRPSGMSYSPRLVTASECQSSAGVRRQMLLTDSMAA